MTHIHGVIDTDAHFIVDPKTKTLKPDPGADAKIVVVQHDHNSERISFELPRYGLDGHDMSLCNSVEVHYTNTDRSTNEKRTGVYQVEDLQLSQTAEDVVVCSWLISRKATKLVGPLSFSVRFACIGENGEEEYGLGTAAYPGYSVVAGEYNPSGAEEYPEILQQHNARLTEHAARIGAVEGGAVMHTAQALTAEQKAQARENIGAAARGSATDEIYFDITADGVLSLKPEYRGASPSDTENYAYALSDNGKNRDGSQNKELPEEIVIPETVGGVQVTGYAYAMFINNKRIKRLVLHPGIKEIPGYFAYGTWNLVDVAGTGNVETLDKYAFATSGIRTANFPALKTLSGGYQFRRCTNLAVADLGGVVTEIPTRCFEGCEKLVEIRNGQSVRKIGECGLYFTLRLKQLPFLPAVTEIGDCGLLISRVDVEQIIPDCQVGTWATAKAFYGEDYWSACEFQKCNTPLRSTFHQDDPRWVDKTIGNTGRTWDKGCLPVCAAMAYSIFEGKDLASPEEFTDAVYAANPALKDVDPAGSMEAISQYFATVGYTVTRYSEFNAANLQALYDALASGAVVIHRCHAGASKTAGSWVDGAHDVLIHGINAEGEVLCVDPAASNSALGVYEAITYAMPVQNRTRAAEGTDKDFFWIVRKN